MGIPMTKKKFAELELSLLHLQQNVEIPETHLVIHPVIQRAVEQVNNNNTVVSGITYGIAFIGTGCRDPPQYLPYSPETPHRFIVP